MSKRASSTKSILELVFILDKSGSMRALEDDTIGGYNSMLEKQKEDGDGVIWSTVLFNQDSWVIHDRIPIGKVEPLTKEDYRAGGTTALLDAVGGAIDHIIRIRKKEGKDAPKKTLFVITTDGMENSSQYYTYETVREMIETQQEKYGWEFIFLGANIDAAKEAGRIGIRSSRAARYVNDGDGLQMSYRSIDRAARSLREEDSLKENVLDEIRKDYRRRGK